MRFLTKQVKLFDWNNDQMGQYDLLKGVYMIGTILEHASYDIICEAVLTPGHSKLITALWLFLYAMIGSSGAMLMLVCGLQFRKKSSMRGAVRSQVKHLWKPYLYTILVTCVTVSIATWITGGNVLAETGRKVLPLLLGNVDNHPYFGITMDGCGPVWFIIVFVVSGIILNAVLLIKDRTLQWTAVLLLYGLGTSSGIWTGIPQQLPFGLYRGMRYTLYMYIGYQMKRTDFFDKRFPVWMLILSVFFVMQSVYHERTDAVFYLVVALGMIAAAQWINQRNLHFLNWLRWLGRKIMPFCFIHAIFKKTISWSFIRPYFAQKPALGVVVLALVYAVTGIGGCILLDWIKRRRIMKKRQKAIGGN